MNNEEVIAKFRKELEEYKAWPIPLGIEWTVDPEKLRVSYEFPWDGERYGRFIQMKPEEWTEANIAEAKDLLSDVARDTTWVLSHGSLPEAPRLAQ